MKKIVVMGVGNYILTDEGVGIHVIKEIMFPNGYKISLDGKGGNLILFRQGKEPEVVPLSSQSNVSLNRFFKR